MRWSAGEVPLSQPMPLRMHTAEAYGTRGSSSSGDHAHGLASGTFALSCLALTAGSHSHSPWGPSPIA